MGTKLQLAAGAAAAALLAGAGTASAQGDRGDFRFDLGTAEPGGAATMKFDVVYRNPDDPDGKPPAITGAVFRLPAGTRIDTAAVPRCSASDDELRVRGTSACPAESRIGGGTLSADTGFGPPVDPVTGDVTVFNGENQLIEVVTAPGTDRALGLDRLTVDGSTLTAHPPNTPGGPPDGRTSVKEIHLTVDREGYATAPPNCPADGLWRYGASFEFADGGTHQVAHTLRCTAPGDTRPRPRPAIAVRTQPARARVGQRTTFRFVARSRSARCRSGAKVAFAGRRARTNAQGVATIGTKLARAGRHRLWVAKRGCATGRGAVSAVRRGVRLSG